MKKILMTLMLFLGFNLFSQNAIYTDYDGNKIIEYTLQDEYGKVLETGFYFNNKMHGTWTSFFPSGKKQAVVKFRNGIKNGKWFYYDEDGRVLMSITYKDDRKVMVTQNHYVSK